MSTVTQIIQEAKVALEIVFALPDSNKKAEFIQWIQKSLKLQQQQPPQSLLRSNDELCGLGAASNYACSVLPKNFGETCKRLQAIRLSLQRELPASCIYQSENIINPKWLKTVTVTIRYSEIKTRGLWLHQKAEMKLQIEKQNSGKTKEAPYSTHAFIDEKYALHVDAFVYDEEDIDMAVDKGSMSRSQCEDCGSRRVRDLEYITHSMSADQLKFLFISLLPDLQGKTILDVGSRTGAVLYGAYLFSKADRIIGVEMNKDFVDLAGKISAENQLTDRIELYANDIVARLDLLQTADIIVMHNVFEFFADKSKQQNMWKACLTAIKQNNGCDVITSPSISDSLTNLEMDNFDCSFLLPQNTQPAIEHAESYLAGVDKQTLSSLHLYTVRNS